MRRDHEDVRRAAEACRPVGELAGPDRVVGERRCAVAEVQDRLARGGGRLAHVLQHTPLQLNIQLNAAMSGMPWRGSHSRGQVHVRRVPPATVPSVDHVRAATNPLHVATGLRCVSEHGAQARHRRVACKGQDDRRLPGQGLRRRGVGRPHPRHPDPLGDARGDQEGTLRPLRRRRGQRLRGLLRRRLGQEEEGLRAQGLLKGADELSSPPTRTARARRSPGTSSRCSSRRCPSSGWCSTRSPRRPSSGRSTTRVTSTPGSSTRRRPAASSTASTATRSRRCSGARSRRACPQVASSPSPPASWSSVSASGWRSCGPLLGRRGRLRHRAPRTASSRPA